jgi:hypothetical protein
MGGAAFAGKLKPLSAYLDTDTPDSSRGAAALLGALRSMQRKKGVPMTFTRLGAR